MSVDTQRGFVSGDTGSELEVTCKDDDSGVVIDLTGSTVRLKWLDASDSLQSKTMSIVGAATDGVAKYKFLADELIPPQMHFEVEITDAGGFVLHNLELIRESVREALS